MTAPALAADTRPNGPRQAAEIAQSLSDATQQTLAYTRRATARKHPNAERVADLLMRAYSDLDPQPFVEAHSLGASMDHLVESAIDTAVQDESILRKWRRYRVIYSVHPDLADALVATDPSSRVPCAELVRMLPHPDPFVVFPRPITMPIGDTGDEVRHVGFYVSARNAKEQTVSTIDPSAHRIALMSIGYVYGADGKQRIGPYGIPDLIYSRMSLPTTTMTHRDLVIDTASRFKVRRLDRGNTPSPEVTVPGLLQVAVPLLVYLCAQNADRELAAPREVTQRRGRRAAPDRLPTVVKLGFRLGPKLGAARHTAEAAEASTPTGRRMRPHVRRAHWHTFRTGKGRQETTLHWLPPIAVHPEEEADVSTVVPVD
jgi:hypothetical protein